jgi:hypothetical protein
MATCLFCQLWVPGFGAKGFDAHVVLYVDSFEFSLNKQITN